MLTIRARRNLTRLGPKKVQCDLPDRAVGADRVYEEEIVIFMICVGLALSWIRWAQHALSPSHMLSPRSFRVGLLAMPIVCLLMLFAVLKAFASFDVRDSAPYLLFYMTMGAAWVGAGAMLMPLLGLSARDDVVERGNRAALYAICGTLFGLTYCFAGANIGDGPGWWVVVFCATLATGSLIALWAALEFITHINEAITVERSAAAGLRFFGFQQASGLILGRSVAGDWTSMGATLSDFASTAWPVLGIALLEVVIG